ncbi:hypothetical protein CMQ_1888 [Grosmannia clavigera kw1407]|uniref:Vacuolar protein sorting-associated protein 51 homolog n=1 Tax=Grosmannia clavigera (strain kw1407 / UAMH 11150) TaxID=655863 RepID=F0XND5_GROCL|nr:uncharacterized protein CMQ_1888 [Grosmannia clavigera kw1407]EFX00807.1 hypothetical protein CMQ_1888 [Grosmannia clavigera kw1407]
MSTIASPREPPPLRRIPSAQTPTSSTRPSIEISRSVAGSPNPSITGASSAASAASTTATPSGLMSPASVTTAAVRRNRAALREYYNIHKNGTATPALEVTDVDLAPRQQQQQLGGSLSASYSEVTPSAMDRPDFDAVAFVRNTLQAGGLEDLLRTYTRVLSEMRALDAEKKSLVYDNYSRLITATETIRKMRANMDPLNPMASTLDPAIAHIYSQAKALCDAMRQSVPAPDTPDAAAFAARARTRQLAAAVLETPDRLRQLMREGRPDEAKAAWDRPRRLLELWRAKGLGGDDVAACLADGDAALRGEQASPNELVT